VFLPLLSDSAGFQLKTRRADQWSRSHTGLLQLSQKSSSIPNGLGAMLQPLLFVLPDTFATLVGCHNFSEMALSRNKDPTQSPIFCTQKNLWQNIYQPYQRDFSVPNIDHHHLTLCVWTIPNRWSEVTEFPTTGLVPNGGCWQQIIFSAATGWRANSQETPPSVKKRSFLPIFQWLLPFWYRTIAGEVGATCLCTGSSSTAAMHCNAFRFSGSRTTRVLSQSWHGN